MRSIEVLLPVRDEQANLSDCLQGLLGLTGGPKIWIIDDGSTDGTAAIAADFAARHRDSTSSPRGR